MRSMRALMRGEADRELQREGRKQSGSVPTAVAGTGTKRSRGRRIVSGLTPATTPRTKEQEVLEVATEHFLKHGYQGTSITAMARCSGISKESVYRYFSGKKQLFEAVIDRELREYRERLEHVDFTHGTTNTRDALLYIAESILKVITTDRTLALRRLIFAESAHTPDVGAQYWRIGPQSAYRNLERIFSAQRTPLDFDPKALSHYFVALLSHKVLLERACGVTATPTKKQIRDLSSGIVDDFMRAFMRA